MPHIRVDGCNTEKQIAQINIHAEVIFSRLACVDRVKCHYRMEEIKERIEKMLEEYFDGNEISSDTFTNHEWNTRMYGD